MRESTRQIVKTAVMADDALSPDEKREHLAFLLDGGKRELTHAGIGLLKLIGVARLLGVSRVTARRWLDEEIKAGRIHPVTLRQGREYTSWDRHGGKHRRSSSLVRYRVDEVCRALGIDQAGVAA